MATSIDSLLGVLQDPVIAWIVMVCGLFGALIRLLVTSGGAMAFADYMLRYIKDRRSALFVTWLLGLSIFIDDYLNALTVGSSMKKVTDKFKVPREMLAYIVDSTAAPICVIIPLSTWAIYISGLIENTGLATSGQGLQVYVGILALHRLRVGSSFDCSFGDFEGYSTDGYDEKSRRKSSHRAAHWHLKTQKPLV